MIYEWVISFLSFISAVLGNEPARLVDNECGHKVLRALIFEDFKANHCES